MKKLALPMVLLASLALGLAACADAPATETAAPGPVGSTLTDENTPASDLGQAPGFTLPTLAGDSLRQLRDGEGRHPVR